MSRQARPPLTVWTASKPPHTRTCVAQARAGVGLELTESEDGHPLRTVAVPDAEAAIDLQREWRVTLREAGWTEVPDPERPKKNSL